MDDNTCLFTVKNNIGAVWELTYRCQYGCLHCCNQSSDNQDLKKNELSTKEIKNGIDQLIEFGVTSMYLSGGDPLVREDFVEILAYARKKLNNKNLFFATNGNKVTPQIAKEIGKLDIGSALISLDGHTPEIAEMFRPVKNNYHIALHAVDLLKQEGVAVTIGSVLWKETYTHIEDLIKIGVERKANTMFFSWLVPVGRAIENPHLAAPDEEYHVVGQELKELKEKYSEKINVRFRRFEDITDNSETCPGAVKNYHLIPDGRLSVCSWAYKLDSTIISEFSIKNKPFKEIIHDEQIKRFKEMVLKRQEEGFGPGCPVLCHLNTNTFYSKDSLYKKC